MTDMIAMNTFDIKGSTVYYSLPDSGHIIVDLLNSPVNIKKFNMQELLAVLVDKGYKAIKCLTCDGEQALQEPDELLHMTSPQRIEFAPCIK